MNKIVEYCGHKFIRVSKVKFENFRRYFRDSPDFDGNDFMGWYDLYDWSLGKSKEGSWEYLDECIIARNFFETPHPEYYVRLDYIEKKKYDLDTIVPKPRKKRLSKRTKMIADHLCDAFDIVFRNEATKEWIK